MEDLASQRQLAIDREGYERAMEGQRGRRAPGARSREADEALRPGDAGRARAALDEAGDRFDGYDVDDGHRRAGHRAVRRGRGQAIDELTAGDHGYVVLARTPFYVESGGQVSDSGRIVGADGSGDRRAHVAPHRPRLHVVRVRSRDGSPRQIVTAEVIDEVRDATRRNHTATHLLHAALRQVLGTHVKQAGSLVAPDRLRFDFVHFAAIAREELDRIERIVNEQIHRNTAVTTEVRSTEEAIAAGAMALFGEKYGDRVRVVSVPGFSMELCGGTHVRATGDIGFFVIVEESGVAAGVRRIEALTGAAPSRGRSSSARRSAACSARSTPASASASRPSSGSRPSPNGCARGRATEDEGGARRRSSSGPAATADDPSTSRA